ncbi:siderophore-interacting protein [Nonomuraea guangzhouensis]|uniref:Siderophore-interacting protein n=1 Tax=Nonomuraea guangzhouensis TaxID=1291555 RepID=A0ABW4GS32_9ACTN|nr:siderophore-interacting protein [Nonomuraea guangzhouensis]
MRTTITHALRDRLFVVGEVLETEQVTPRMRKIRIGGEALAGLKWTPGQHVRLAVKDIFTARAWLRGEIANALRTYSIWHHDPTWHTIELIGFDHGGDGPGTSWIRNARPGQEIAFTKPEGSLVVRPAPYHLFAGEETASVAFGAMLRALPEGEVVFGAVEADGPGDHLDLPRDLTRVCREGASAASSELLVEAVRKLALPDEPGVAYLAGEARTIQAVRAHLVRERGWQRGDVRTKPFWTPGKRGLD